MQKLSPASYFYIIAVAIVVALIVFTTNKNIAPSPYDEFAQCLSDKGVKMYGAWWCPHCQAQKELFGSSVKLVNYIECSSPGSQSMNQVCKDAGIEGYPTWEFADQTRASGEQTLEALAEKSGCVLPVPVENPTP